MQNIILLHGALGTSNDLEPLAGSLRGQGIKVHTFSFSGHGENNVRPGFGIGHFASELEDLIRQKQLKDAMVFGYSMGGYVALYLAHLKKDLIRGIITLGTKFNWSKETVDKETKMLNADKILEKAPAFAKLLETKHGQDWKGLLVKTAAMMAEIGDKNFLSPENLKTIDTPVLIGLADKDQMVTLDETVAVFKALPNAAMYMLPGSKHQMETVNTDFLSRLIIEFGSKHN